MIDPEFPSRAPLDLDQITHLDQREAQAVRLPVAGR